MKTTRYHQVYSNVCGPEPDPVVPGWFKVHRDRYEGGRRDKGQATTTTHREQVKHSRRLRGYIGVFDGYIVGRDGSWFGIESFRFISIDKEPPSDADATAIIHRAKAKLAQREQRKQAKASD